MQQHCNLMWCVFQPPYEDDLEQQTIAEMLESKSDRGMSRLDKVNCLFDSQTIHLT